MKYGEFGSQVKFMELVQFLQSKFEQVEFGSQGDDWVWISRGDERCEIDTMWSFNLTLRGHGVKSEKLVMEVAQEILPHFELYLYDQPQDEGLDDY